MGRSPGGRSPLLGLANVPILQSPTGPDLFDTAFHTKESEMPIFITQGRYTQSAITGMIASPEDRAEGWKR